MSFYLNGVEQTGQRNATLVVAANDTSSSGKALADYVCDGVNDHVEIQAAIDALPATGGEVLLLEGTYNVESSINLDSHQTLRGCGRNTILLTSTANLIFLSAVGGSGTEKTDIVIADLQIDGGAGSVSDCGVYFEYVDHSLIQNVYSRRHSSGSYTSGIYLYNSDFDQVINNTCQGNTGYSGINLDTSNNNIVRGNICQANYAGIYLYNSDDNIVSDNICEGNDAGVYLDTSNNNTVSGNICQANGDDGLALSNSDYNTVSGNNCQANGVNGLYLFNSDNNITSGNICVGNSQGTDNTDDNITLSNSSYNLILGNLCRDGGGAKQPKYGIEIYNPACVENVIKENDLHDSGKTFALVDSGTDTAIPEIYIPVKNPDSNIGDHPAFDLPDGVDTTLRFSFQVPLDFTQLVTAQVVIVPGGTGSIRRSFATDWGKLPRIGAATEDYNAGSDAFAASEVAVTINRVEGLTFNVALDDINIGDVVGVTFTREGTHELDTVGAACKVLGLRVRYV